MPSNKYIPEISNLTSLLFMEGGGEMGALMRRYDWANSELGPVSDWPSSLRTTISIMLNAKFPMFLFWGKHLIQFYNDAYRPSLGMDGKHPKALGQKGVECWPEIWPVIYPQIQQIMAGGEATLNLNQLIPIYRNSRIEDVYWTYSYMPVKNEEGMVGGVLVICNETTDAVNTLQELKESRNQLEFAIEAAELGTWDYDPMSNKFSGNNRIKDWFGLQHDEVIDLEQAINNIIEADRQRVIRAIQFALQIESGGYYDIEYSIINPLTHAKRAVRAKGKAWFDNNGIAQRLNGTLQDITDKKRNEEELQLAKEQLQLTFDNMPFAVQVRNKKGELLYINNEAAKMTGFASAAAMLKEKDIESVRRQVIDKYYLYEENGEVFDISKTPTAISLATGKSTETIYLCIDKLTNERLWVLSKSSVLHDGDGNIHLVVSTNIDITLQKTAEEKIRQSENQLRNLANSIPQMVWITKPDGWIEWYNQRWYDYTGTTYEEMQGWGWQKVHHPAMMEGVTERFRSALKSGLPWEDTFLIRSQTGEYRWFLSRAHPLRNERNEITQWFGTNTDITEQRLTEEALKESEEKFRLLAESLPHLVWITDAEGRAIYASKSWIEYSGFDPYASGNWDLIVHAEDIRPLTLNWMNSLATGELYHVHVRLKNKAGEYRWFSGEGVPLYDETLNITKWIGAFTDIHDQKLREEQKDEFISIASHEMKTPLTTAKGYIDLLLLTLGAENSESLLYATKAKESLNRLQQLIVELLDVSKLQNGKLSYKFSEFDFNQLLDSTIENMQSSFTTHKLEKEGVYSKPVIADKERIEQVLINLLTNAVKYSLGAGKVMVTVGNTDTELKVCVRDFGIGISEKHLEKIFERYYRVDEHAIHFQGLGIGLYISDEIIRRHNGRIWVESKVGKGSTFCFTIPLNFQHLK